MEIIQTTGYLGYINVRKTNMTENIKLHVLLSTGTYSSWWDSICLQPPNHLLIAKIEIYEVEFY